MKRPRLGLFSFVQRRRQEREMKEEMSQHLERAAERLRARGMSAEAADRAARRAFGNLAFLQEEARDARAGRWLDRLVADSAFALRYFRRRPILASTIFGVLSLGMGINVALFVLIHSMTTMPAPGIERDPSLVRIRPHEERRDLGGVFRFLSYPEVRDHAALEDLYADVAAWASTLLTVTLDREGAAVVSARAQFVTDNYFPLLGVRPIVGSVAPLAAPPDAADPPLAAIVGYDFWWGELGGRPDVLDTTIRVNGHVFDVVGVAPPRFAGPDATGSAMDLWLPLSARPVVEGTTAFALASYDSTLFSAVARVRPGVTPDQATAAAEAVAAHAGEAATGRREGSVWSADVVPLIGMNNRRGSSEPVEAAGIALAIALLSLAVTCTNVASLFVGAAAARRREIAARLSLGASRARVIRQLLTESCLLAGSAGLAGIFVVWAAVRIVGPRLPEINATLGWPAALFTFALSLGTGVLCGLSPALHGTRVAVSEILKDSAAAVSGSRMHLQRALVVGQVAVTQPLLVGLAAVLLVVLGEVRGLAPTPLSQEILWLQFGPSAESLSRDERIARAERVRERLVGAPGIRSAIPQAGTGILRVSAHPADAVPGVTPDGAFGLEVAYTAPAYFATLGLPIVAGRDFDPSERPPAPRATILLSEELARRLWGNENPVGRRILSHAFSASPRPTDGGRFTRSIAADAPSPTELTVIGVVDRHAGVGTGFGARSELAYVPLEGVGFGLLIRTEGPAEPHISAILAMVREEAPDLAVSSATLAEMDARSRRTVVSAGGAAAGGGLIALLLSAIGLYAVVAFSVNDRTREVGIRSAIGASRWRITAMFLGQGARLGGLGLAVGLPLSLVTLRFVAAQIGAPSVSTTALAAAVAAAVTSVTLAATWIPANRAASVEPIRALRAD
ncbi:MAG: ABC transporter permease [Gemmatimonadota bacterium]